jgi:AcrR family transcriptional regulator
MTLYTYVSSKEELLDALVERTEEEVTKDLPFPQQDAPWEAQLVDHFSHLRRLLSLNPGIAQLLLQSGRMIASQGGSHLIRVLERYLQEMTTGGLSPELAFRLYSALQQYTAGFALREGARKRGAHAPQDEESWRSRIEGLPSDDFPVLAAARRAALSSESEEQFLFGLNCLLRGAQMEHT